MKKKFGLKAVEVLAIIIIIIKTLSCKTAGVAVIMWSSRERAMFSSAIGALRSHKSFIIS